MCDGRPRIVCLCGSTRFKAAFDEANYQETMTGRIVLSVGFYMHATDNKHGKSVGATAEQKMALEELHLRKIDLADEVLVLNVGGYIGESTRNEIDYARTKGKPVRYLESERQADAQRRLELARRLINAISPSQGLVGDIAALAAALEKVSTIEGPIIHFLKEGRPLCGFDDGPPKDWPPGHAWVDGYSRLRPNCEACREALLEGRPVHE